MAKNKAERQFSLRWLFGLITIVALIVAILTQSTWISSWLYSAVLINLIGFAAGYFITHVLNFPRDGGYRNPEIRAQSGEQSSQADSRETSDETGNF